MMWTRKSNIQKAADEFYAECARDDFNDKVHLAYERIFAEAWVDIINNLWAYPDQQVDEFEYWIVKGVELQWGKCDVQFLRDQRKIIVTANDDGRKMELVSGEML